MKQLQAFHAKFCDLLNYEVHLFAFQYPCSHVQCRAVIFQGIDIGNDRNNFCFYSAGGDLGYQCLKVGAAAVKQGNGCAGGILYLKGDVVNPGIGYTGRAA